LKKNHSTTVERTRLEAFPFFEIANVVMPFQSLFRRREQVHCHSYRKCDALELGCGAFVRAVAHDGNSISARSFVWEPHYRGDPLRGGKSRGCRCDFSQESNAVPFSCFAAAVSAYRVSDRRHFLHCRRQIRGWRGLSAAVHLRRSDLFSVAVRRARMAD